MPLVAAIATDPTYWTYALLFVAIAMALGFEFVNGFHDTANAVATVIYTHTLKPTPAVVWSGVWNLIGVLTSSGAVAFGVVALLPVELVLNVGSAAGFAMVFSLLVSAIVWNLGTWYLGLPASSSHTLIGSIIGVGLANAMAGPMGSVTEGVNWAKAHEVALGLVLSPMLGFLAAALLLLAAQRWIRSPELYQAPKGQTPPPKWIRGLLMLTCTGVSYAHGSNDGQKGMGLIVLILVGIFPGAYALNPQAPQEDVAAVARAATYFSRVFSPADAGSPLPAVAKDDRLATYIKPNSPWTPEVTTALAGACRRIGTALASPDAYQRLDASQRIEVRTELYLVSKTLRKFERTGKLSMDAVQREHQQNLARQAEGLTNFIPAWVKYAVALSLGLGTMIGYRRIVRTVGEKIGKDHLTYAQGASAELVAMGTILVADRFGLPISTTHVLSSGIAGTMAANRSGLQGATLRNILLAWILTLPVCIFLGALLFATLLNLIAFLGLA